MYQKHNGANSMRWKSVVKYLTKPFGNLTKPLKARNYPKKSTKKEGNKVA